jgi:predicted GNAT family N-acyltransferase
MNVKIVKNQNELDDALTIRHRVFVDEQNVPAELEVDEHEDEAIHVVLYDDSSQPIGAGRCRKVNDALKVERICVLKEHRKTGAGKLIMKQIEDVAKDEGITKLKLNSQTHAQAFYASLGYQTVSDEFMDAGIPHVTMIKEL